jgi:hypothetical protein
MWCEGRVGGRDQLGSIYYQIYPNGLPKCGSDMDYIVFDGYLYKFGFS